MSNSWPKRRDTKETCERKIPYSTWEAANAAAILVWIENPRERDANPGEAYLCPYGEHYHFGH